MALAGTGLHHIQVCSFVNPRVVPGWADAAEVVAGFEARPEVQYTALWFNGNGLERALAFRDKLHLTGSISLTASEAFTRKNPNRSHAENLEAMRRQTALHLAHGVAVERIGVMAAFGCNYQGDIAPAQVVSTLEDGFAIAAEHGVRITHIRWRTTMGWAAPHRIERVVGEVMPRAAGRPDDACTCTHARPGGANAHAGLRMGVAQFDSTVGGLALPHRGQKGRGWNICTEELVLLCRKGYSRRLDLDRLIEVGRMAEASSGHVAAERVEPCRRLDAFRKRAAA